MRKIFGLCSIQQATWNTFEPELGYFSVCTGRWSRYPRIFGEGVPRSLLSDETAGMWIRRFQLHQTVSEQRGNNFKAF